jgi:hypothetical protein
LKPILVERIFPFGYDNGCHPIAYQVGGREAFRQQSMHAKDQRNTFDRD